jgi:hypothetical protein
MRRMGVGGGARDQFRFVVSFIFRNNNGGRSHADGERKEVQGAVRCQACRVADGPITRDYDESAATSIRML